MQYNFSNFKIQIKKTEEFLSKEYRELNIGRASPLVLDGVMVDSYGTKMPIKNSASISIEDQKTLRVIPWDKGQIKEIEKAIMVANLGLSTAVDDIGIRVVFPQLTTETREKLVKLLKEKLEDARISVRKEREQAWDEIQKMEKEKKMTEDEKFRGKDELQKIVDEANKNLEEIFSKKEKEVMG
ncbi:MAG: ribosome recycling factor [Candidatus Pacebacteria bacterium]|nr:ribosome recycling factor [Candidatus Paceibacterota bacterium]MCF7863114.1 ribosome recycling factor [Candidatus Paceibacterota bacterium]